MRGIAVRQELTDEWDKRNVQTKRDYAILTNEISKATFGKTVDDYKQHKSLRHKDNLRDHMDDTELILTMLGETTTTRLTQRGPIYYKPGITRQKHQKSQKKLL